MLPDYIGSLAKESDSVTYEGTCFKTLRFSMEYLPTQGETYSIKVHIEASGKKSLLCQESLFFSTTDRHHSEAIFMPMHHSIMFRNLDSDDIADLN